MVKPKERVRTAPEFYQRALRCLAETEVPFLIGGAYAMREYGGIVRDTKDLDIFCTAGDYPRLLSALAEAGYQTELTDALWIAKAFEGDHFIDLIFNSRNRVCAVDETWFERARPYTLFGCKTRLVAPEEIVWSKSFVQDRERFDGADVAHIFRKQGTEIDWKHLLMRMEVNWEILLEQIVLFRFVFPSERDVVPRWLVEELTSRLRQQLDVPTPHDRVCRGGLLSRTQYLVDVEEWGYRAT